MFHADDYVDCLKNISVEKKPLFQDHIKRFFPQNDDCPVFNNMYDYC